MRDRRKRGLFALPPPELAGEEGREWKFPVSSHQGDGLAHIEDSSTKVTNLALL